jgi:hypothetical protein
VLPELQPAHLRHHHVGDHQIDRQRGIGYGDDGVLAGRRLEDSIAVAVEHAADAASHRDVVLDDEDGGAGRVILHLRSALLSPLLVVRPV